MDTTHADQLEILDVSTCLSLLGSVDVGRLGIAIMNVPDIFPVNFIVDHGTVVFRTAEGTKFAAAVLGRAVAFEADGYDPAAGEAWSVIVHGHAHEIKDMYEMFDALELPLFPWHNSPKYRFVRIVPTEVTGRRFAVDPSVPRISC
jgi:nitroimidazol reductase NimA-like FMN-containing flavoprotein (pyridoxamine 5'-phosphate oxidase superfamily)